VAMTDTWYTSLGIHINVVFTCITHSDLCYRNPSPTTDSLFMKFWYPWIYFFILGEFLFQGTWVLSHCCWDNLEIEKLVGGRRKKSEWRTEQMFHNVALEEDLGGPSCVCACSRKGTKTYPDCGQNS
jgi:hypothetical protein